MRRTVKKHEPIDEIIDALVRMQREAKEKRAKRGQEASALEAKQTSRRSGRQ
jgi:hypothetical protein